MHTAYINSKMDEKFGSLEQTLGQLIADVSRLKQYVGRDREDIMTKKKKNNLFKVFDSKTQSVLLYSSEIWGLHRLDSIERVHLMACKRYLGVPIRTQTKWYTES